MKLTKRGNKKKTSQTLLFNSLTKSQPAVVHNTCNLDFRTKYCNSTLRASNASDVTNDNPQTSRAQLTQLPAFQASNPSIQNDQAD
jgi:hypothetical protein